MSCLSFTFIPPQVPPFLLSLGLVVSIGINLEVNFCCHFRVPPFTLPINVGISDAALTATLNALVLAALPIITINVNCPL